MREKNYIAKDVINGHRATLAHIWMHDSLTDDYVLAKGEAIRHPEDKHDEDLANTLATARALKSLANKLERRANGRIKCNDDNARRKLYEPHSVTISFDDDIKTYLDDGRPRCLATKVDGEQCTRSANESTDYEYCGHHS